MLKVICVLVLLISGCNNQSSAISHDVAFGSFLNSITLACEEAETRVHRVANRLYCMSNILECMDESKEESKYSSAKIVSECFRKEVSAQGPNNK